MPSVARTEECHKVLAVLMALVVLAVLAVVATVVNGQVLAAASAAVVSAAVVVGKNFNFRIHHNKNIKITLYNTTSKAHRQILLVRLLS